jgi:hypothetical protein
MPTTDTDQSATLALGQTTIPSSAPTVVHADSTARSARPSEDDAVTVLARAAGVLYLVVITCGIFAEVFVRSRLIVDGDAAATARNILDDQRLFRIGFAADLIMFLGDVALAILLYVLFKPVSALGSMMAAGFRLTQTAIIGINLLFMLTALLVLRNVDYMSGFDGRQVDGLAALFLELHEFGYLLGLTFFGLHAVILGSLVYHSGFAPKPVGILLGLAGAGYLIDSAMFFLISDYDGSISAVVLAPALIAEISFCGSLLIRGFVQPRRRQRVSRRANPAPVGS